MQLPFLKLISSRDSFDRSFKTKLSYLLLIVVLPELPFPGPSSSKRTDNLLHSPTVADEAREILHRPDRALVQQLSQALCIAKSTTDQL